MSGYVPITAATTAAGAAAAAAAAARMRREEEDMTGYNKDDLDGWEFKIIRSNTAKFKDYKFVRQVCEQEAKAGWEMVEKFDNYRIRFKRKVDQRKNDQFLDFDPYRSHIGMGNAAQAVIAVSITLLVILLILGGIFVAKTGFTVQGFIMIGVLGILIFVGVIVAAMRKSSRYPS